MKFIFLAIIAALVIFSFTFSKRIKSGKDFLIPNGGLPFIIVAFTMAATQFGSSMLIGGVQQAQQQSVGQGFYPAIYTLLAASASCFINIFISPRYRKFGDSVTPPDFVTISGSPSAIASRITKGAASSTKVGKHCTSAVAAYL